MKIQKIEYIPGAGINILATKSRTLFDENGVPVQTEKRERIAVGIGDFADEAQFKAKVKNVLSGFAGAQVADLLTELAAEKEKVRKLQIDLSDVIRQRDAKDAELAAGKTK